VEDTPNNEEATLVVHGLSLYLVEDNVEPRLVEDPLIETRSSSCNTQKCNKDNGDNLNSLWPLLFIACDQH
jgi:hypothetical protein